ncbi:MULTISPECIES: hypothetical protein [Gammaproteobacteria]|uniref:hypothetical protein n=1 Tax=Gammaproteobacteria TaxID=1236 RepID=UPI000DCFD427|nr:MULTISPECIES: hypothetical protein [Gammaproteobacteria]RTE86132.1 hypothetical protein DQX04_06055 [Aliidiomarina sp. B3213]TCZ91485.1 hypothetical protein EYQ95_06065 [Lysobacter sp. N42]
MASALKTRGSAIFVVLLLLAIASTAVATRLHEERQAIATTISNFERVALQVQLRSLFAQAAAAIDEGSSWPPAWYNNSDTKIEAAKRQVPCEQFIDSALDTEFASDDFECIRIELEAVTSSGARLSRSKVLAVGEECEVFWLL